MAETNGDSEYRFEEMAGRAEYSDPEAKGDVESLLSVGKAVVAYFGSLGDQGAMYKCMVRGWNRGGYILIELPEPEHIPPVMEPGTEVLMKLRHEGHTWHCATDLLDVWQTPASPHFRAAWPDHADRMFVRRWERIDTAVECNVVTETGDWLKGQIRDLGGGGCRVILRSAPEAGSRVYLSFTLPNGSTLEDIESMVRSASPFGQGAVIGCQFLDTTGNTEREVDLFVSAKLEETRRRHLRGQKRMLIIEPSPKVAAALRGSLEKRGFDCATAAGLVDGCALLRSLLPDALMINHEQGYISGFELCRIIKGTPGFRRLPVFIYGPEDASLVARAKDVSAAGYVPYRVSVRQMVDSVLATPGAGEAMDGASAGGGPAITPESKG